MTRGLAVACTCLLAALAGCAEEPPPRLERSDEDTVLVISDPRVRESSGLALSARHSGVLYTHNDAGNEPWVFAIGSDGTTRAALDLEGAPAADWEDIAVTRDGRVWIGDIGGNQSDGRAAVNVVTFKEPDVLEDGSPDWTSYRLTYPDGSHNAEALLVDPRTFQVYVVTKGPPVKSAVYRAPLPLREGKSNKLTRVGPMPPSITAGAFAPDGSGRLALRNYRNAYLFDSLLSEPERLPLPRTTMGESLVLLPDGDLLIGSEGRDSEVILVRTDEPTPS